MSSEKKSLLPTPTNNNGNTPAVALTYVDYNIDDNQFRAYYDNAKNMVFVVDNTHSSRKPNVLLVVPADGDRKWDDILVSDFGIDLETIRPRKDNKYQKLDIEYGNVYAYKRLIQDYQSSDNLQDALHALNAFRDDAVRRNALARLDIAQDMATRAHETIDRTKETITELNTRLKELRTKLSIQKKSIGREPTKQSAAKILRSDSQIETTGEKIERARRRLANARRRLAIAEDDITAAQNILDLLGAAPDAHHDDMSHPIMMAPKTEIMLSQSSDTTDVPQFKKIITEPKAEDMADEEVKPLFDKDPEILDEEIAFKPIDFGVSTVTQPAPTAETDITATSNPAPAPLSFTPPQASTYAEPNDMPSVDFAPIADVPPVSDSPVLNSMRPVTPVAPQPTQPTYDAPQTPATDERAFAYAAAEAPVVQQPQYDNLSSTTTPPASTVPEYNNTNNNPANTRPYSPMPDVTGAGATSGFRPTSPIRGTTVAPVAPAQGKSKLMYYIMLIMLIALSIFTLWIYQRSTVQNIPELTTTTPQKTTDDTESQQQIDQSPFIGPETEQIVPDTDMEPEPVAVEPAEPAPVTVEPETVVIKPEPVVADFTITTPQVQTPFLTEPVEKTKVTAIDIETVVNKPAYNVSQNEKMFVAAPNYETDAPANTTDDTEYTEYAEYTENIAPVDTTDDVVCADGAFPDANGCCGGEVFTDMEDGTFACCQPVQDGECFAPLR